MAGAWFKNMGYSRSIHFIYLIVDNYTQMRRRTEEQLDPSYGTNPQTSHIRPPRLHQFPPSVESYQHCTSACLPALKKNTTYDGCPNYSQHPLEPDLKVVIEDAKY